MHIIKKTPPKALLLISTGCRHCLPVLDALSSMVKEGILGHLEVINVAVHPEKARSLGATSAPWFRIGVFEFFGRYTEEELKVWVGLATTASGFSTYFIHLIEIRRLDTLVRMVKKHPGSIDDLLHLLGDQETPMAIRIGIGAAIEELQERGLLAPAVPKLIELTRSDQSQVRADACHYLGLTGDPRSIPVVKGLLVDTDPEVREIASETLDLLEGKG